MEEQIAFIMRQAELVTSIMTFADSGHVRAELLMMEEQGWQNRLAFGKYSRPHSRTLPPRLVDFVFDFPAGLSISMGKQPVFYVPPMSRGC